MGHGPSWFGDGASRLLTMRVNGHICPTGVRHVGKNVGWAVDLGFRPASNIMPLLGRDRMRWIALEGTTQIDRAFPSAGV